MTRQNYKLKLFNVVISNKKDRYTLLLYSLFTLAILNYQLSIHQEKQPIKRQDHFKNLSTYQQDISLQLLINAHLETFKDKFCYSKNYEPFATRLALNDQQKKYYEVLISIYKLKMGCLSFKQIGGKRYISQNQLNQSIEYFNEMAFGGLLTEVTQRQMQNRLHRHIVAIIWRQHGNIGRGTGLLISKNLVLTCAHNLYNNKDNKKEEVHRQSFQIYVSPYGLLIQPYKIQSAYVPLQFKTDPQMNSTYYDYALIKLKNKVNTSDFICLKPYSIQQFQNTKEMQVAIFGYPITSYNDIKDIGKNEIKFSVTQSGMKKKDCIDSTGIKNQKIFNTVSTQAGQSGSPIIQMREDTLVVMGIHKGGCVLTAKNGQKREFNTGRLITQKLIKILERQAEALGGQMFKIYKEESILDSQLKSQNPQPPSNQMLSIEECMQRGEKLLSQKSFRNARQWYRRITQMNPYHSQAYYNMGLAFEEDRMIDCAIQAYKRAVKINPNNGNAKRRLSALV